MAQAVEVEAIEHYRTLTEAAGELGVNRRTLGEHLRTGKVQGIKIGSYFWLISRAEIERIRETRLP